MPLIAIGISHRVGSSEDLARLGACCTQIAAGLRDHRVISGSLMLSTCNRFEVYVDAIRYHEAVEFVTDLITECVGDRISGGLEVMEGEDAVRHAMAVSAGLDSMVVGEAEIAGQVRAAMAKADLSPRLRRLFQHALTTSKAVTSTTSLGAAGRSLASVALDLVESRHGSLAQRRALIIGTGAYARIVVMDLHRRGLGSIVVHSPSGRAERFAATHAVTALPTGQLREAVATADVVIACSGGASPAVNCDDLSLRDDSTILPIVDLSPGRDVAQSVRDLAVVDLLDLDEVGRHSPQAGAEAVCQAWGIVERAVAAFEQLEEGRAADPAVVAMRTHISRIIDAELASVDRRYPPAVASVVARSLHRVSNSLLHTPTVRAHELARNGELEDYQKAMSTLFGIDVEIAVGDSTDAASSDDDGRKALGRISVDPINAHAGSDQSRRSDIKEPVSW